jgi:hypothetical protein
MSAILDASRAYRYRLERRVGDSPRTCLFVMLNPSTADETQDDPTIRRCIAFAKREGCGRLVVCNLYALRATNPRELRSAPDPRGPDNGRHIAQAAVEADLAILAWGGNHLKDAEPHRIKALVSDAVPTYVLRWTKGGDPGHPLYVPADAPLIPLRQAADQTVVENAGGPR